MGRLTVPDRQTKILDAAEHAFADFGFDGASLRHIVREAGANLATVYYYFGSKEGLMQAVLRRRFDPLRQEHLERLQQYQRETQDKPLTVERILESMLLPPLRLTATMSANRPVVMRLIGRIVTEPNARTQAILHSQYKDVRSAYLAAFRCCLPNLPLPDLLWRIEFVWGAMAFILCNPGNIKGKTDGVCDPLDTPNTLAQMINFFSAGLRAPATACSNLDTFPQQRVSRE